MRRKAASRGAPVRSDGCIVSQYCSKVRAINVSPSARPASPSSLAKARATMTSRRRSRPRERNSSALSSTAAQSTGLDCEVGLLLPS